MSEYTKEQEAKALERYGRYVARNTTENIVLAMAKRTAEAEARADASEADAIRFADDWAAVLVERDALKARVAELEAKTAPPPVVVTREVVEALSEFARTWARFGADCEPENAAARLVVALGEALEVKP